MEATQDWDTAKKQIRKLGIRVTTSLASCRLGCCVGEHIDESQPIIWQSANRWRWTESDYRHLHKQKHNWRYLNHDNLTPEMKWEIAKILEANGVPMDWDFREIHAIGVDVWGD